MDRASGAQQRVPERIQRRLWAGMLVLLFVLLSSEADPVHREKRLIGATERITVAEAGLSFLARIDSGAEVCSIHVTSLEIEDPSPEPEENIGKDVHFVVQNGGGQVATVHSAIQGVAWVRSAIGGRELRYKVYLTLQWKDVQKRVLVNLNDREHMDYKLLMGRNWLEADFLVDVGKNADE